MLSVDGDGVPLIGDRYGNLKIRKTTIAASIELFGEEIIPGKLKNCAV